MTRFQSVATAVEQLRRGGIVIVMDAEDRENEGDFLAAADLVTPETIDFMITHGRGHLCLPITGEIASRLDVEPLVSRADDGDTPCFAMPLDSRLCGSGISPLDRALTIQQMVDPASRGDDFIRPGHIFPLIARDGGVLCRPGHTESAIDLTEMAGRTPAGVICEICSRDGRSMAKLDELQELAHEFDLPIVTIDQLIAERKALEANGSSIQRRNSAPTNSPSKDMLLASSAPLNIPPKVPPDTPTSFQR